MKKVKLLALLALASLAPALMAPTGGYPYYPTFGTVTSAPTVQFYANSGAHIDRLNDRVFIGDAATNDANNPNTVKDWLTTFQTGLGIPSGSVANSQTAILTTVGAANNVTPIGQTIGCRTSNVTSNNQNCVGIQSFAVNNSASFTTSVYGMYSEAFRQNNVVGAVIGNEQDSIQRGAQVGITPWAQQFGQAIGLQVAAGAQQGIIATATFATNVMTITTTNVPSSTGGFVVGARVSCANCPAGTTISSFGTGTGGTGASGAGANGTYNLSTSPGTLTSRIATVSSAFDSTAAINIQANPNSFTTGINIANNAITGTDGINGVPSPAIQMSRLQGIYWFGNGGIGVGSIYNDASATAGSSFIEMGQGSVNFWETSTTTNQFAINSIANAANHLTVSANTATFPPGISASGSDTNININLVPKGTGFVSLGGPILNQGTIFAIASGTGACVTTTTLVGGNSAGSFVCTGTAGASSATLTLPAATHNYACYASDSTGPSSGWASQTVSASSVKLVGTVTTTGDTVTFGCTGY